MTISQTFIQKTLVRLGFVVLLLALAQQVTRLFWALQTTPQPMPISDVAPANPLSNVMLSLPDVTPTTPKTTTSQAPKPATGRWALQGVYYEADDPAESLAMISVDGNIKAFAPGDELVDGVVITQMTPERVDVDNRGTPQSMYLPENTLQNVTDAVNASEAIKPQTSPQTSQYSDSAQTTASSPDGAAPSLPKDLQRLVSHNPMQLLKYVRITPVNTTNEFAEKTLGYQLVSLEPNILASVGLAENDVLIALNNRPATPENLTQVLADVKKGKKINAKISRDGKITVITLNL